MTAPDNNTGVVQATEGDRHAAADMFCAWFGGPDDRATIDIRQGHCDHTKSVQAFARHRIAAARQADERVKELEGALAPFAFLEMGKDEDEGQAFTTQEVWETIYRDRLRDWIGFDDI